MLAIRLQRRGRKGHAQFRVIVQDSRLSPKSERVVASLGSYDPHSKVAQLDAEKAAFYLNNGAQPSNSVAKLFSREKIALPDWVEVDTAQKRVTRNPDKLRKNQPEEPAAEVEAPAEESDQASTEAPVTPAEEASEETAETEAPAEEAAEEAPAEESDKKSE